MIRFKGYKNGLLSLTNVASQLKTAIAKKDFFNLELASYPSATD
jgi:hypothetical protein